MQDRIFYVPDMDGEIVKQNLEENFENGVEADSFDYMYREIFHCESYTDFGSDYERQGCHIREGDVVVDIGGNVGMFSRRAWEKGASQIIAFEPQRKAYLMYLLNSKENMMPFNMAVSDSFSAFDLEFGESKRNIGGGSITGIYRERGQEILHSERVVSVSLDWLFEKGILKYVDFLKVDVEGAEIQVLNGISDENLRKFRCIAIEIHRSVVDDATKDAMVQRIQRLGYSLFTMSWGENLIMINCWRND
jgi:FkbM family methyltransferase